MPRVKAVKPACSYCHTQRYMGCWLGRWICNGCGYYVATSRKDRHA